MLADNQIQVHAGHRHVIHLVENVSRKHPRVKRRRPLEHFADRDNAGRALLGHHGPDSTVHSGRILLQRIVGVLIVVNGIRIIQPIHESGVNAVLHVLHILIKQKIFPHNLLNQLHLGRNPLQLQASALPGHVILQLFSLNLAVNHRSPDEEDAR